MKLIDYGLIFLTIFCVLWLPTTMMEKEISAYTRYEIQYHMRLDNAIDDGLVAMTEGDDIENITIYPEACIQSFYRSFFGNFGASDNLMKQQSLRIHLPVVGIVGKENIIISYQKMVEKEGQQYLKEQWTEPKYFEKNYGGYCYRFFVGRDRDHISVYLPEENRFVTGTREEIGESNPSFWWLKDKEHFEQMRKQVVLEIIKGELEKIANSWNLIGKQYGYSYQIQIPELEKQTWCRTMDDIGMIVLFQGYPVEGTKGKTYTRFVFSGARTYKRQNME